jgi:hypothetical protein
MIGVGNVIHTGLFMRTLFMGAFGQSNWFSLINGDSDFGLGDWFGDLILSFDCSFLFVINLSNK